jgi:predicted TIM-barrel fold metal-dependent hydrolase
MKDSMQIDYAFPENLDDLLPGVIDFHTHIDDAPDYGWIDPPEKLVPLLDEANVAKAVIMTYRDASAADPSPLEYIRDAVAKYPSRLVGFARLRPSDDDSAVRLLEQAVSEFKMAGLKLHPVGTFQPPSGPSTVRLVSAAAEMSLPILFHCGDENFTTPLAIEQLVVRVPTAKIVLGHMGGYFHTKDAIEVARRNPSVYLETSATPYPASILDAVRSIGAHRVIFGSDGPGAPPRLEVRKVLGCGLDEHELTAVLRDNALALIEGA